MSKEKLKKIVHNNKALYKILLLIRYVQYKMIWFAKEISSYIRVIGIGNKRYKNIRITSLYQSLLFQLFEILF